MSASNPNPPFNDPSYSRERLELETRVLAAALRQSLEIGDTEGSSLAHEQIFLLLKASQELVIDEPLNLPREVFIDRGRQLPDIDWGGNTADECVGPDGQPQPVTQYSEGDFSPPASESGAPTGASQEVTTIPDLDSVAEEAPGATGEYQQGAGPGLEDVGAQTGDQAPVPDREVTTSDNYDALPASAVDQPAIEAGEGAVATAYGQHGEAGSEPAGAPVAGEPAQGNHKSSQSRQGEEADSVSHDLAVEAVATTSPWARPIAREADTGMVLQQEHETTSEAASFQGLAEAAAGAEALPNQSADQLKLKIAPPPVQENLQSGDAAPPPVLESAPLGQQSLPPLQETAQSGNGANPPASAVRRSETGRAPVINDMEADYYKRLNVSDLADFHSIHLAFWRMVRFLLRQEAGGAGTDRLYHLKRIQRLWIAHDILCDPVTRADYDFRKMGLRGGDKEDDGLRTFHKGSGPRTQLRIGELLQCAGLLEQNELDIAADMHKAMPEMMFGTFLVKQGFIEQSDLNCVLVGQQLLKAGEITVVQFQTVMIERSATGLDIGEMLLAKGYVTEAMLEAAYRNQSEDTLVKVPAIIVPGVMVVKDHSPSASNGEESTGPGPAGGAPAPAESQGHEANAGAAGHSDMSSRQTSPPLPAADAAARGDRALTLSNAAPAWKDQLDWSAPPPSGDDVEPPPSAPDVVPAKPAKTISAAIPKAVPPQSNIDEALAASVRAIADIWAEPLQPVNLWGDDALSEPLPAVPNLSDNPFVAEVQDQGHSHEQDTGQSREQDPGQSHEQDPGQMEGQAAGQLPPAADLSGMDLAANDLPPAQGDDEPEIVSEVETSGQLPSLGELELRAQKKEARLKEEEEKRRTGDWQIMSVPGSAISSLFLDDEPEAHAPDPLRTKEITGNMLPYVDEDEQLLPAKEQEQAAQPSAEDIAAPQAREETKSPTEPGPESRRARRRRTRH